MVEVSSAIKSRRSIRKYKSDPVPEQTIRELLDLAVWAPSGMNRQPWVFAVVQDRQLLKTLSDRSKQSVLDRMQERPILERYRRIMTNPKFNIFYQAPTLILIYGDSNVPTFRFDCSLVAQNLMLAAWDRGLGSCWIGFAHLVCDSQEVKRQLSVPQGYELVASIILGYPEVIPSAGKRDEPRIVSWKR